MEGPPGVVGIGDLPVGLVVEADVDLVIRIYGYGCILADIPRSASNSDRLPVPVHVVGVSEVHVGGVIVADMRLPLGIDDDGTVIAAVPCGIYQFSGPAPTRVRCVP
ncbi:hypothetical protein DSECCO2_621290 [anaerobic digester metagenome]